MRETLQALISGRTLDEQASHALFSELLTGGLDEAQIGAVLALLAVRRPSVDELVGAARVMREHVTPVAFEGEGVLIDTCGTGGTPKTFNVSTVAAIIAASSESTPRVRVAKHGNRSRTGRGSAEVLAALGVNVDATPEVQARCLSEAGVCFSFAIHHHPAMRHAGGPRRSLGFPTIFNMLGPLTNPAGARRQMVGVYAPDLVDLLASTLQRLGAERAGVLHSDEGLDEVSLATPTRIVWVDGASTSEEVIDPGAFGLAPVPASELTAGDVEDAARIAREILAGEPGPHADMAALNAGVALRVAGVCDGVGEGLAMARSAIRSGRALATLQTLVCVSSVPA